MTSRSEPTIATILKEVKAIRDEQKDMRADVDTLLNWRQGIEIAKAAVDEYKQQQAQEEQRLLVNKETKTKTEMFKQAAIVLGYIGIALALYLSAKGLIE